MKVIPESPRAAKAHKTLWRRGGSSIEYILIVTIVVIPIALLGPKLVMAIAAYAHRMGWVIRTPLG